VSAVELLVVSAERHVEIASREGARAETRRRLSERLVAALLQNTRFAGPATARAALGVVLPQALEGDRAAARLRTRAEAWERTVDAFDDAIGSLRRHGVTAPALGAIEEDEPIARLVRRAMNALDARLEKAGLVDERCRLERLGAAIAKAPAEEVARIVGATRVRARHVLRWDACDAVWWRALGASLARAGGGAVVELPVVAKPIDASRASDPFEALTLGVAKMIDDAPIETAIEPIVGDATFTGEVPDAARARIEIRRALDAEAEARAVVAAVREAIEDGVPTDAIAIGVPRPSPRVRAAIERCFEDAGLDVHFAGPRVEGAFAEVVFALLEAGELLDRHVVAEIARSRVIDASAASGIEDVRAARIALRDLADVLERTATAEVDAAIERLVATASAAPSAKRDQRAAIARRLAEALSSVAKPGTRAEHARRARTLFARLGVAARAGGSVRAALSRDDGLTRSAGAAARIARAEVDAYARDARLLDAIGTAIDDLDRAGVALGPEVCAPQTFVHELRRALRIHGAGGGARAGAIRATTLEQLAGEPLALLVVLDANDGVLPARSAGAGVLTPALETTLSAGTTDAARSLVELAVAVPRSKRVVVCYRTTDDDGAALAPSPLVSWLERGGVRAQLFHSAPLMGAPVTERERALALVAVAPDKADRLAPHAARVAARERVRETIHAGAPRELGALETTDDVRALFEMETGGGARPLAVTALERIARCPFQGFAAQLYGALDDDPRTDDAPDRREEGILAHEALGAAFTAAAALWPARPRDRGAIEVAARAASNAVLARSGGALVRASLDRIRLEVERIVALAIDDEDWNFAWAERGFGNAGDEWPALVLEDARGRVALRGRIDRLDTARDAVRAVDYKRRVSLPAIVELGASAIQVPLYAIVARRGLGVRDAQGRYLSTISPAKNATTSFQDRFDALVAEDASGGSEATRAALDRIHTLRAGDVAPVPTAPKWCASCGLDGACRRPRFAVTMIGREDQE
jgi:hypothetical protein